MPDKVLDADYIKDLLSRKKTVAANNKKAVVAVVSFESYDDPRGFDVLKLPQCGYPQPGDKGDIWARWVDQKRTGAAELIERMSKKP